MSGGKFEFDDGGHYCGEWMDGKAHGYGICSGPNNEGKFEGLWHNGFEVNGIYKWKDDHIFKGEWKGGKINGIGVEISNKMVYLGEWKNGLRHGNGVFINLTNGIRYEGTWIHGLQEGYGAEISTNGGYYLGQWKKGLRHGYGIRVSANGLKMNSLPRRMSVIVTSNSLSNSLKNINIQQNDPKLLNRLSLLKSTDNSFENYETTQSSKRPYLNSNSKLASEGSQADSFETNDAMDAFMYIKKRIDVPVAQDSIRTNVTSQSSGFGTMSESSSNLSLNVSLSSSASGEVYKGEWIADKRNVYGISEYLDGSRYCGAWRDNARHGHGFMSCTTEDDMSGKWSNNELVHTVKKGINLWSPRIKSKVRIAKHGALEAEEMALEKGETALKRGVTARKISEQAKVAANVAENNAKIARSRAMQFDIDFSESDDETEAENVLDSIISGPTLMAFELSKGLTPHLEASHSRKSISVPDNISESGTESVEKPAKLAGLFAAMDLTISGAVNSLVPKLMNKSNDSRQLRKTVSLNTQNSWLNSPNSISALNSAILGASAFVPAFINTDALKEEPRDQTDNIENEADKHRQEAVPSNSNTSLNRSSKVSKKPRLSLQKTEMSAYSLFGDKILLDYKHAETNVRGKTEPVFRTNAPRPKLNNDGSISEAHNVTGATGLYRTIVGEIPRFLTINSTSSEDRSPDGDKVFVDEEMKEAGNEKSCENKSENDNHPKTVQRTLSKFRRQLQISARGEEKDHNDYDRNNNNNHHDTIRQTKSDSGKVTVVGKRGKQIPIRPTKSCEGKTNTYKVSNEKKNYVSAVKICLKRPDVNRNYQGHVSSKADDIDEEVKDEESTKHGASDGVGNASMVDRVSTSSDSTSNWSAVLMYNSAEIRKTKVSLMSKAQSQSSEQQSSTLRVNISDHCEGDINGSEEDDKSKEEDQIREGDNIREGDKVRKEDQIREGDKVREGDRSKKEDRSKEEEQSKEEKRNKEEEQSKEGDRIGDANTKLRRRRLSQMTRTKEIEQELITWV
eukprot:gene18790-20681_t